MIINPKTGKKIKVGGPTYQKLLKTKWAAMITDSETLQIMKPSLEPSLTKPKKEKGCTNQGKYKGVPQNLFCGPEGGSCPQTYPVNTKRRARAALAYARYAPDPEGIKRCVRRIENERGW